MLFIRITEVILAVVDFFSLQRRNQGLRVTHCCLKLTHLEIGLESRIKPGHVRARLWVT